MKLFLQSIMIILLLVSLSRTLISNETLSHRSKRINTLASPNYEYGNTENYEFEVTSEEWTDLHKCEYKMGEAEKASNFVQTAKLAHESLKCFIALYKRSAYAAFESETGPVHYGIQDIPRICNGIISSVNYKDLNIRQYALVRSYCCLMKFHALTLARATKVDLTPVIDKCDLLKTDSRNQAIKWMLLLNELKCYLRGYYTARSFALRRSLAKGTRALIPPRVLIPWTRDIFDPQLWESHPPEDEIQKWANVTFIVNEHIGCDDELYIDFYMERPDYIDASLIKILADRIGSIDCLEAPKNPMKYLGAHIAEVYARPTELLPTNTLPTLYPHVENDQCALVRRILSPRRIVFDAVEWPALVFLGGTWISFSAAVWMVERRTAIIDALKIFITGLFNRRQRNFISILCLFVSGFGLIYKVAIGGTTMSLLMTSHEHPQIETLQELYLRLTKVATITKVYKREMDQHDIARRIMELDIKRGSLDETITARDVAYNDTVAIVASCRHLFLLQQQPETQDPGGVPLTHVSRECLMSPAYKAFHVRRGWSQREFVSLMLMRLVEAGVPKKIDSEWINARYAEKTYFLPISHRVYKIAVKKLVVMDFFVQGAILVSGLIFATMVFLAEKYVEGQREMTLSQRVLRMLKQCWKTPNRRVIPISHGEHVVNQKT